MRIFGRRRRDLWAYERVQTARARSGATPGSSLVWVRSVQHYGPKGTKAWVDVEGDGRRDAFFWHARVHPGQLLVVASSTGWGPHTRSNAVFYVPDRGIYDVLDAATLKAADRHARRASR